MKLILGLGNPGSEYAHTRHNAGFLAVDALARRWGGTLKRDRAVFSFTARKAFRRQHVLLAQPATYMNLSGIALKALIRHSKVRSEDILVISDDLDLALGRLLVKNSGSVSGHRGLASIAETLGTTAFLRLRIGIGRPPAAIDPADYVLDGFTAEQRRVIDESIATVCEACELWVAQGTVACMNVYNKKKKASNRTATSPTTSD